MNRLFSLFVIGLMSGGVLGFALAAGNGITFDGHDHSNPAHHMSAMDYGDTDHAMMHDQPLELAVADAPTVEIKLHADPMAGWNLEVMTDKFAFSPQNASLENVAGEGHAHVYVNGMKHGRLYATWTHLAVLPKGEVEVSVSLNSNDHRPLFVGGKPVAATQTITVE